MVKWWLLDGKIINFNHVFGKALQEKIKPCSHYRILFDEAHLLEIWKILFRKYQFKSGNSSTNFIKSLECREAILH